MPKLTARLLEELTQAPQIPPAQRTALEERLERLRRGADPGAGESTAAAPGGGRAAAVSCPPPLAPEHLTLVRLIDAGGMGEVWEAHNGRLGCSVALKVILEPYGAVELLRAWFRREATLTARLQHPGIVPVHEIGELADGRPYYTMKLVRGQPYADLLREHHRAQAEGRPPALSLREMLAAFHRCCEAVGYAHAQGVIHRDLKPANVRVGEHGEVIVLDWGIARLRGEEPAASLGRIEGTPGYMAPEQRSGGPSEPAAAADVYALGVILHEILWGARPDQRRPRWDPPDGLAEICERALDPSPERRHPDAGALGEEIRRWLDGARRRERAAALVAQADDQRLQSEILRDLARRKRAEAERLAAGVRAWEPVERKAALWDAEDEAALAERQADLAELRRLQLLSATFTHVPDFPAANQQLARYYRDQHAQAEDAQDEAAAARWEILLRAHDRGEHGPYLAGEGQLSLRTDPPGARVRLFRYEEQRRRLVPAFVADLGVTPLSERALPRGSYRLEIEAPGREIALHPVLIGRLERAEEGALRLPERGELGDEDCLVTPGWTRIGGDPEAANPAPRQRLWVDGFVMRRFPVTNAEYLEFLNDLLARGEEEEAARRVPSQRAESVQTGGARGAALYGLAGGRYVLAPDAQGDLWLPDWPAVMVDWPAANAYAQWRAARDGLPWRLPDEAEWERAARGADGRCFPWGNFVDPTYACYRSSHPDDARGLPPSVHAWPLDESPFGVRGLGGGVREWCHNRWGGDRAVYRSFPALRGGAWNGPAQLVRAATRGWATEAERSWSVGFRLVRSLP